MNDKELPFEPDGVSVSSNYAHESEIPDLDSGQTAKAVSPESKETRGKKITEQELKALKNTAKKEFDFGVKAVRNAVSATLVWHMLAIKNKSYHNACMTGMPEQANSSHYSNAVRYCLGMTEVQKSSINKYSTVMKYCYAELGEEYVVETIENSVKDILKIINSTGGFSGCVIEYRNKYGVKGDKGDNKKKPLNADETEARLKELQAKKPLATFDSDMSFVDGNFVIVIGKYSSDTGDVGVVDIIENEKLLKKVVSSRDVK